MHILIATTQVPFVQGGAEIHARSLLEALNRAGHRAEIVSIPFKWYPPERILDTMLACRLLDLIMLWVTWCITAVDGRCATPFAAPIHN